MLTRDKPDIARAIHANAGVAAWYRRQLQGILARMTASLPKQIRPRIMALDDEIDRWRYASELGRSISVWEHKWRSKFDTLPTQIAKIFADKSQAATQTQMMAAFKDSGFTVAFSPTPASVAAYESVAQSQVALIKSIPEQYLADVGQLVHASVMKGGDLGTLSKELQARYGVSHRRAAFIAGDQNNKAKAVMEKVRRTELGLTTAKWQHSHAGKVPRPTHVAMNGKTFEIEKGMWDSAVGQFVQPGELPNCRCSSSAIIAGFEDEDEESSPAEFVETVERPASRPVTAKVARPARVRKPAAIPAEANRGPAAGVWLPGWEPDVAPVAAKPAQAPQPAEVKLDRGDPSEFGPLNDLYEHPDFPGSKLQILTFPEVTSKYRAREQMRSVTWAEVHPQHRGKGIAQALYRRALEDGPIRIKPDERSVQAKRVYDKLIAKGYAKIIERGEGRFYLAAT
jgi:GNAT superfamily N-acetyltransferase